ncbi:MAG: hypothetical protein EXS27_07105 [Pedosphaera sp.]|nr:hypothetical protein [Pedosphaera sp.]
MRLLLFTLAVATVVVSPACRKRPEPAPTPTPSVDPVAASTPATVQQISQALQSYMQNNSDFPKDLKVLVDMKLLPNLPVPPPGKQYVIDRKAVRVSLEDR